MTLTEFLLARIAEDEAQAQHWDCDCAMDGFPLEHGYACKVRVLAECEAKRRIVELHRHLPADVEMHADFGCWICHRERDGMNDVLGYGWCETSRLLALPYSSHQDYQQEWNL